MDTYPWDKYIDWTIQDFGPLHVPAAGQTVAMDSIALKLYRKLIEWEQKKPFSERCKRRNEPEGWSCQAIGLSVW